MQARRSLFALLLQAGLLAWFLLFPSLGVVQKYFGGRMAVVYAGAGTMALFGLSLFSQRLWKRLESSSRRAGPWMIGAIIVALVIAFATLYPRANSGEASWLSPSGLVGGGSDRDESLNLGVRALFAGKYPYYEHTQLGNPVSQLPGGLLLAAPFVWLGNAAWQNLVWLGVWLVVLGYLCEDSRVAAVVGLLTFGSSPIVLQDFVTGGDMAANSIIVLAACLFLERTRRMKPATFARVAAVLFAGLAFATRLNFVLLLPLVFVVARRDAGLRTALWELAAVGLVFLAVTVPFYLHDPGGFAPLAVQDKFRFIPTQIPHGGLLLPGLCGLLSCVVAFVVERRPRHDWLIGAGVVLIAPPTLLILVSAVGHSTSLQPAAYGLPGLFFGVAGICTRDARAARSSMSSRA